MSSYNKEKKKLYYQENKEKIKARNVLKRENRNKYMKDYYRDNRDKLVEKSRNWREENKDKQKLYRETNKDKIKNYKKINKDVIRKYKNNWIKNKLKYDNEFKLGFNIRCLIRGSFNNKGIKKSSKTELILDCSIIEFKAYLESKFEPWMNWDNYGIYNGEQDYGWDIDHIIPLAYANTLEDIIRLNHFTNLQPLCSKINRDIKRNLINFDIS